MTRGRFQGTAQVMRYNWPYYAAALLVGALSIVFLLYMRHPWIRLALGAGGTLAILWVGISIGVTWYVYDHSPLYKWDWVATLFPQRPNRWANLHAGLDETTSELGRLFGGPPLALDMFDPREMTEASIRRARSVTPSSVPWVTVLPSALPLRDASLDAVFLILVAHELRTEAAHRAFWREIGRILRTGGRVLLVEHLRNLATFLAYGPGFLHFMPRARWTNAAETSGCRIEREFAITPFVRVFLLEKSGPSSPALRTTPSIETAR